MLACLAVPAAGASAARADFCGIPDTTPLWVDFAGHYAPIPAKPGMVLAIASGTDTPAAMRAKGAATVFFDLNFNNRIGTTTKPADPATIADKAKKEFDYAVATTGCGTPIIAEKGLYALGPAGASRAMRQSLRGLVSKFSAISIPSSRIALELQFNSSPGLGARAGLQPASSWFEIVKLEALLQSRLRPSSSSRRSGRGAGRPSAPPEPIRTSHLPRASGSGCAPTGSATRRSTSTRPLTLRSPRAS